MYGNSFGRQSKSLSGGKRVWNEIFHSYPVGGVISNISDFAAGSVIPAGSPAIWENGKVTVVTSATIAEQGVNVNGLTHNDVYVEEGTAAATVGVVYAGVVYESRLDETIPDTVWANLAEIKRIKEA